MTDQAQTPSTEPTSASATITPDAVPAAPAANEPVQDNSTTDAKPQSFLESIKEEYREGLSKFEKSGADGLAKSYLELEAKLSGDKLPVPKGSPEDDPDGWQAVYDKLGRPEQPDAYSFREHTSNDPMADAYAQTAHKLGFSDAQAGELYDWFRNETAQRVEELRVQNAEMMKQELGSEFLPFISKADEFLSESLPSELLGTLKETGIAHNPDFIKFVHNAAVRAGEDASFRTGDGQPPPQKLADNPYVKNSPHFNLTRQGLLERGTAEEQALAARYREEAGYSGY